MKGLEPKAVDRIKSAPLSGKLFADTFEHLAKQASEFRAKTLTSTFGFVADEEECSGEWLPEIVLKVTRIE